MRCPPEDWGQTLPHPDIAAVAWINIAPRLVWITAHPYEWFGGPVLLLWSVDGFGMDSASIRRWSWCYLKEKAGVAQSENSGFHSWRLQRCFPSAQRHVGSGAHSIFYPVATRDSFPRGGVGGNPGKTSVRITGPYQAVRWQQEPKQLYSLTKSTVSYKMFLYSHEKCRSLSVSTVTAGTWIASQPLYTYSKL
jgi:hypothetical protein